MGVLGPTRRESGEWRLYLSAGAILPSSPGSQWEFGELLGLGYEPDVDAYGTTNLLLRKPLTEFRDLRAGTLADWITEGFAEVLQHAPRQVSTA